MASRVSGGPKVKRVMTQAINLIFEFLKNKERIQIWLYENSAMRIEGVIIGFDEYMNITLEEACELNMKTKARKQLGKILLKGDCITLIQRAPAGTDNANNDNKKKLESSDDAAEEEESSRKRMRV